MNIIKPNQDRRLAFSAFATLDVVLAAGRFGAGCVGGLPTLAP